MKKIYTNPICDLERFDIEDVITTSPVGDPVFMDSGDGKEVGWLS